MHVARKSGCISPTEDVTSIENTVRLHSRIYMFAPHPKIGRVTVISMDHSALQHGTICQGVTLFSFLRHQHLSRSQAARSALYQRFRARGALFCGPHWLAPCWSTCGRRWRRGLPCFWSRYRRLWAVTQRP